MQPATAAPDSPRPARRPIRPRSPRFDFGSVPKHWFADNALATHMVNGVNLLFPAGERFFVRSVHHYADRILDPELREQVKGFFAQEGRHANAHEKYFERLESQGYRIRGFLRAYEAFAYGFVERIASPRLRLAVTAACEHFTATMAHNAFEDQLFAHADPTMRALLLWHAVEEIEHKAVAFDVLREVAPSRSLRTAGLAVACTMLGGFWLVATGMLLAQDRTSLRRIREEMKRMGGHQRVSERVFGRAIRGYVRRGFHPSDETRDVEMAGAYLASVGMA